MYNRLGSGMTKQVVSKAILSGCFLSLAVSLQGALLAVSAQASGSATFCCLLPVWAAVQHLEERFPCQGRSPTLTQLLTSQTSTVV